MKRTARLADGPRCQTFRGSDMANRTCSIDGCENPHKARGWCKKHWQQWRKRGDPEARSLWAFPESLLRRLAFRADGCVVFTGKSFANGYGRVWVDGSKVVAHRAMWELMIGPIPDGMQLDHLCRNRACVNVGHLEVVTPRENTMRGEGLAAANARKTHCPRGHPYDVVFASGSRGCRRCIA